MTIGKKLFLSYGIIGCISLVIGLSGYAGMRSVMTHLDAMHDVGLMQMRLVADINTSLLMARGDIRVAMSVNDPARKRAYVQSAIEHSRHLDSILEKFEQTPMTIEQRDSIRAFRKSWAEYCELREPALPFIREGKVDEVQGRMDGDVSRAMIRTRMIVASVNKQLAGIVEERIHAANDASNTATLFMIFVLTIGAILTVSFAVIISRMVSDPLKRGIEELKERNETRLKKISDCYLTFDAEPDRNIQRLITLTCELLGAGLVMYNRYENDRFNNVAVMHGTGVTTTGFDPECRLCRRVIDHSADDILLIGDLAASEYANDVRAIIAQGLDAYAGKSVHIDDDCAGTLCVMLEHEGLIHNAEKELLGIIASAIAVEEKRGRAEEALRKSERLLRDSQDVAKIGYFRNDIATGKWESSASLNTIFGIDDAIVTDGQLVSTPFHLKEFNEFLRTITDRGRCHRDAQIIRESDGEPRWVSAVGELEYDNLGEPIRMIGTIQDITDRKRLEQQLLHSQKLDGVGTLAGGIAHDFNNLLAMVLGSAELLQQKLSEGSDLKKYVDRIIEASERGTSISRQLLIFSRPDQAELKPISLSRTIIELRDMLTHFLPKSISVKTEINVDHGIIMGDAGQIHQALLNLALNAGDAMTNNGVLTISEYSADSEFMRRRFSMDTVVPYVVVSVADTGTGMEEAMLTKIFDPFYSTKEKGKGTGLGLAMVHSIVKTHQGFIDVCSKVGQGTTFSLYFPSVVELPREAVEPRIAMEHQFDETILLVDDEEHLREMLTEYLESWGYDVVATSNGAEALALFQTHHRSFDLVITDLGMPIMGGEDLFRKMKKIEPAVKVMVTSGYLDGTTKEHLLDMGIMAVLTKPSKLHEIQNAIRTALGDK